MIDYLECLKMISSRDLNDLLPVVKSKAESFKTECKLNGFDIIFTSTYRDNESQASLYAQGRTAKGPIITYAKEGESFHQYRVAFDIGAILNGKYVRGVNKEELKIYEAIGAIGILNGLEWAGNWKKFKELLHFQYTGGLTIADLKAGKVPT